jgi:hypothetical protein
MRLFIVASAIFFATLALSTGASAGTLEGSVPANRTSLVHAYSVADPSTCASAGKPKMRVSTEPQHGKVSFKWGYVPAGKRFRGCAGGRMRAMTVYYTPAPRYRGKDTFTVGYSFADMSGYITIGYRSQKIVVHVK